MQFLPGPAPPVVQAPVASPVTPVFQVPAPPPTPSPGETGKWHPPVVLKPGDYIIDVPGPPQPKKEKKVLMLKFPDGSARYLTDDKGKYVSEDFKGTIWVPETQEFVRYGDKK